MRKMLKSGQTKLITPNGPYNILFKKFQIEKWSNCLQSIAKSTNKSKKQNQKHLVHSLAH